MFESKQITHGLWLNMILIQLNVPSIPDKGIENNMEFNTNQIFYSLRFITILSYIFLLSSPLEQKFIT